MDLVCGRYKVLAKGSKDNQIFLVWSNLVMFEKGLDRAIDWRAQGLAFC